MPRPFFRSELVAADLIWLLDLTYAGHTWRFATETVVITDADGNDIPYRGTLEPPDVEEGADLFTVSASETSASLSMVFPEDVALLVAHGHMLSTGKGDLSLWIRGTPIEDRYRVIDDGKVNAPSWGAEGEDVRFTLSQRLFDDRALFPDANAVIDETTWPDAVPNALGLVYPQVFGVVDPGNSRTQGTPAPVVDPARCVMVAGHRVRATTVGLYNKTQDLTTTKSVVEELDGKGRLVSVAEFPASWQPDDDLWVVWSSGGGRPNATEDGELEGAGDVIQFMLQQSTVGEDAGRVAAAASQLNAFKLGFYIDERVSPWDWIRDNVLDLLPISLMAGADGFFPLVWNLGRHENEALESITAGPGWARDGFAEAEDEDVVNEFTLRYAQSGSEYLGRVTIGPDEYDSADAEASPSPYAISSAGRFGRSAKEMTTSIVADAATAHALATKWVRIRSSPRVRLRYDSDVRNGWLKPGDAFLLTEDGLHLEDQLTFIERRRWRGTQLSYRVVIIHDGPRDAIDLT